MQRLITKLTIQILAILYCLFIIFFILISLPVYLFRVVITFFAKLIRPDFGDILNKQSAYFVGDYLAETNPRSNLVLSMIFEGHLALEEVQALLMKNWISNKELDKLQQYPVKWMGFTFWKNIPKPFLVNDYVHEYSGDHVQVTDQELDEFIEKLLNRRPPKYQSPWELHLIQNYRNADAGKELKGKMKPHSVLILKWHHCLMDGMGAGALLERLFQQRWNRQTEAQPPLLSTFQKVLHYLTFPVKAFFKFSNMLSYTFVDNPFKVPDSRKKWHQFYARSGIIPIQLIKDIKSAFGVSYTSVLIAAISAAVHKTGMQTSDSAPLMSVLPARGINKRRILSNHMTATTIDIPTTSCTNPVDRLATVNKLFFVSRRSVEPILTQWVARLLGAHFSSFNELFLKNKRFPMVLTNFSGAHADAKLNENAKWIHTRIAAGCLSGDCGIGIAALSHGLNMELHIEAEKALMTRKQAQEFLSNIRREIEALGNLVRKKLDTNKK